jgi:hypothetical protein
MELLCHHELSSNHNVSMADSIAAHFNISTSSQNDSILWFIDFRGGGGIGKVLSIDIGQVKIPSIH